MAIGWLSVLQMVPWGDVISNAPKVAEAAKKLWNAVAKKSPAAEMAASDAQPAASPQAQAVASLQAQLAAVEAAAAELHGQMLASSELIKVLAEQNTQLIQRIETNRVRLVWLAAVTVVSAIVALAGLVLTLVR